MGIEAFCPNGHRMKVKDHLAGRLGVCPTCGSRFRLPDVSVGLSPAREIPARGVTASPGPAGLPLARTLSLDPAVIPTLPMAVPCAVPGTPVDFMAAMPPANAPPMTTPHAEVPLVEVPVGSRSAGGSATNRPVTISSVPLGSVPLGSASLGTASPESTPLESAPNDGGWPGASTADPGSDWGALPRAPRVSRRRVRDSGGTGLAVALLAMVVIAAMVAWMILRSRGIM